LSIFLANDDTNQKKDLNSTYNLCFDYFSSLSLKRASHVLEPIIKRSHVAIWKWIQKYSFVLDSFDVDKHDVNSIFIDETEINVKTKLG